MKVSKGVFIRYEKPADKIARLTVEDDGCLIWTGSVTTRGYGTIYVAPRNRRVHIVAWELVNGPVPDGMELDHLCMRKLCVRTSHLEPVTHQENVRRAHAAGLYAQRDAHRTH